MNSNYKFKIEKTNYDEGTFLLGFNFNTNNDWYAWDENGNEILERESYLILYLGKFSLIIGKFH